MFRSPQTLILTVLASGVGFIVACFGGLFVWVGFSTGSAAAEADRFLSSLVDDQADEAYASTALGFRQSQDEEEFTSVVDRLDLVGFSLDSWVGRTLDRGGENAFTGTLQREVGATLPFVIQVVKESGSWKVLAVFDAGRAGVGAGAWFKLIPSERDIRSLVQNTLIEFNDAVQAEDFTTFREKASIALQIDHHEVRLRSAFQGFIDNQVDFSEIADLEPVFVQPPFIERIARDEMLKVVGYYPIEPDPLPFLLRYTYQHPEWKLRFFNVIEPGEENDIIP